MVRTGTTEIPGNEKAVGRDDGTVEGQYHRSSLKNQQVESDSDSEKV